MDKVETGKKILDALLQLSEVYESRLRHQYQYGYAKVKFSRYILSVSSNFTNPVNSWYNYNEIRFPRAEESVHLNNFGHRKMMWVTFRGALPYYQNFSGYFLYAIGDDQKKRLQFFREESFHMRGQCIPYWSYMIGLPFTLEKLYGIFYSAINRAFKMNDKEEKYQRLLDCILAKKIEEI